ncbi:MAG: ATP-binding protein [Chloroflexi bacterium]|nr:ATP-binding protein [Chloroflexota bacterium]
MADVRTINFTVDSELLRELGERLVGRQYIALAELVKNSYDADATRVEIRILDDSIEVLDNGHGMTEDDFASRWMRVGSTHKVHEMTSPRLKRKLTGSKGVGRLAVQFLATELELTSVPRGERVTQASKDRELFARVDWETAVQPGDLTQATAAYDLREPKKPAFPLTGAHGTKVTLKRLKHEWSPEEFQNLAREIWFLQPPFRSLTGESDVNDSGFEVSLSAPDPAAVASFDTQMARILDLYRSRIVGRLLPADDSHRTDDGSSGQPSKREMALSLELEGQPMPPYKLSVPVRGEDSCLIDSLDFEIRIFTLRRRQPYGITVQQARDYMAQWGGVHIYDAGFRIPYAGPAADWLKLEFDHAHRLTQSKLLPSDLRVPLGLNHLPTNSRVLGVVNIDTSREARVAAVKEREAKLAATKDREPGVAAAKEVAKGQHLQIQVSRDRLVGNRAFQQLQDAVRFALDYYATRLAAQRLSERASGRKVGASGLLVRNVWDVLEKHEGEIPPKVASELRAELDKTVESLREQADWTKSQSGLLGAMATVGSTAMAFDHQLNQQLSLLERHAETLDDLGVTNPGISEVIAPIATNIKDWIQGVRDTRAVFSPISDERNRTTITRFRAQALVRSMADDMRVILRGVSVDVSEIDEDLLLPNASYPIWMAIFHNVLMNASNAMLDSGTKRIAVSSTVSGESCAIRIQDTGVGISLNEAESLFEPLKRSLAISAERRALGYGGTGLGLAIVRLLATDLGATVRFAKPDAPFRTCFELAWREET